VIKFEALDEEYHKNLKKRDKLPKAHKIREVAHYYSVTEMNELQVNMYTV